MRIGIDAMGSDNAPAVEVKGALAAIYERKLLDKGDKIVLVGRQSQILPHLSNAPADWREHIEIRDTDQVIGMDESPVVALREKPNSSIVVLAKMHKDGELDGCISAGNTGACVASAQMMLGRLPGVLRPGIAIGFRAPGSSDLMGVCDVGSNIMCKPQHLVQYGIMTTIYMQVVFGVKSSRVGLLSVGEEDAKGNELVKKTHQLLRDNPYVNFVGNVEGRDMFRGVMDVVVCDGFVGNVIIKTMEGLASGIVKFIANGLLQAIPDHAAEIKKVVGTIAHEWDFNEYGGAPLLGVNGIYIICHGASDYRGLMNAVRVVKEFSRQKVNEQITQRLAQDKEEGNA